METIRLRCLNESCFYHKNGIIVPAGIIATTGDLPRCMLCNSDMIREEEKNWLAEIAEDEEYWIGGVEDDYPSVIAYEYRRLREYCRNGKAYAVVFSLKDNFESLLKYSVLLSYAWVSVSYNVTDKDFADRKLSSITKENTSFGEWVKLAQALVNDKEIGSDLPAVFFLDSLARFYQQEGIVAWRNEKIGHGAMELEEDRSFRDDVRKMILCLKNVYCLIDRELRQHELWLAMDGGKGKIKLAGADHARKLPYGGRIEFRTADGKLSFCVDPYVVVRKYGKRDYGVYFFDNQKPANRSKFLAYTDGRRIDEPNPYFIKLRRVFEKSRIKLDMDADSQYLTESQIKELDIQQMSQGFVTPTHLVKWLSDCISKHGKGVFLLQMERGMGKSIFTEKISGLSQKPVSVCKDLDVRTYHISRSQAAGIGDVTSYIEYLWSHRSNGSSMPRMPHISDYEKEGMDLKSAFCAFLGNALKFSNEQGYNRIMTVFDGLDEIQHNMLWELIPEEGDLPDGVYILLTSRITGREDIPENIVSRIDRLPVTEKMDFQRDGNENKAFLEEYLKRTQADKMTAENREELIKLSDSRVLYIGLYCCLLNVGLLFKDLPEAEMVAEKYLEVLEERYGEKESLRLRELIVVLATLGSLEALTLKTLGDLLSEGGITLRLAAMVRDISPLTQVQRSEKGNLYSIANPDLAIGLSKQIPETENIVRALVQLAMSAMQVDQPIDDGEEAVITHVTELALQLPEKTDAMGENARTIFSNYVARQWVKFVKNSSEQLHLLKCYEQVYLYRNNVFGKDHPDTLTILNNIARTLYDLGRYREALATFQEVYVDRGRTMGKEHPDTLTTRNNVAAALDSLGRYKEALEIYRDVYEFNCRSKGKDDSETLITRNNMAVALIGLGQYKEALEIQRDVYEVSCRVFGKNHPGTLEALNNVGSALLNLGHDKEALEILREVYEAECQVLGKGHPNTLTALNGVGCALGHLGRDEKALDIFQKVNVGRGRIFEKDHPDMLAIRNNIAETLGRLGHHEEALAIFREVYEAGSRVLGKDHPNTLKVQNSMESIMALINKKDSNEKL